VPGPCEQPCFIFGISGGRESASVAQPLDERLQLEDSVRFHFDLDAPNMGSFAIVLQRYVCLVESHLPHLSAFQDEAEGVPVGLYLEESTEPIRTDKRADPLPDRAGVIEGSRLRDI
jgi:hypothetical protein